MQFCVVHAISTKQRSYSLCCATTDAVQYILCMLHNIKNPIEQNWWHSTATIVGKTVSQPLITAEKKTSSQSCFGRQFAITTAMPFTIPCYKLYSLTWKRRKRKKHLKHTHARTHTHFVYTISQDWRPTIYYARINALRKSYYKIQSQVNCIH